MGKAFRLPGVAGLFRRDPSKLCSKLTLKCYGWDFLRGQGHVCMLRTAPIAFQGLEFAAKIQEKTVTTI